MNTDPTSFRQFAIAAHELLGKLMPGTKFNYRTTNSGCEFIEPDPVYKGVSIYTFTNSKYRPLTSEGITGRDVPLFKNTLAKMRKSMQPGKQPVYDEYIPLLELALEAMPDAQVFAAMSVEGHREVFHISLVRTTTVDVEGIKTPFYDLIKITGR